MPSPELDKAIMEPAIHAIAGHEANIHLVSDQHLVRPSEHYGLPPTQAEHMLSEALLTYGRVGDPIRGLQAAEPQFKASIAQADSDAAVTLQRAQVEFGRIQPHFEQAAATQESAVQHLAATFDKVPADQQARVTKLLDAYAGAGPLDPVRALVARDLAKYPGLMEAAAQAEKATENPVLVEAAKIEGHVETAVQDQAATRLAYAKALRAAGRTDEADAQIATACKVLGLPEQGGVESRQ